MQVPFFFGGEDSSYATLVGFGEQTTAGMFRSGFAREAVGYNSGNGTSATWPPAWYGLTNNYGNQSNFFFKGRYITTAPLANNAVSGNTWLAFVDANGYPRILICGTGTAGQIKICTRNQAGTVTTIITSLPNAIPATCTSGIGWEVVVYLDYAASGRCYLQINSVIVCDTGAGVNLLTDSATSVCQTALAILTAGNSLSGFWSELCGSLSDPTGVSIVTGTLTGPGDIQNFTGTVTSINEVAINDSNFIYSGGTSVVSVWDVSATPPSGAWDVLGVALEVRAAVGAAGPQHIVGEWKASGTITASGTLAPTIGSFQNGEIIAGNNVTTGGAWNPNFSDLTEIGFLTAP